MFFKQSTHPSPLAVHNGCAVVESSILLCFICTACFGFYFRVHATAFKSVTEMVRESEIRKADPGKVIMKETKHS
jgi:hypothetical protein